MSSVQKTRNVILLYCLVNRDSDIGLNHNPQLHVYIYIYIHICIMYIYMLYQYMIVLGTVV